MPRDIECSIELIRPILSAIDNKVQEVCINGKKSLPTTSFAKELAPKFGTEWIKVYSIISFYVESRPELEVGLGPNGGIRLKKTSIGVK
jgi:hypothetical protein